GDPSADTAAATPRLVVRIAADGTVDSSTALTDAYDQTTMRGATSVDGTSFWVAGDNAGGATLSGGLRYVSSLGASTTANLSRTQDFDSPHTPDNVRGIGIFGGQLYDSSGSNASIGKAVLQVGTGVPTSGSQPLTTLTTDGASTNAFFFADLSAAVPGV